MTDFKKIVEKFQKDYTNIVDKRIAVYGTGKYAKTLISNNNGFNICAVIDRDKSEGEFLGLPIYSLQDVCDKGIVNIIIAASLYNEKVIYDRIKGFAETNGIELYGLNTGEPKKYFDKYRIYGEEDSEPVSPDMIKELINEHDVISFDVFDTLISRRTLIPQDVFLMTERIAAKDDVKYENLAMYRIQAERNLASIVPNLNEIYKELGRIAHLNDDELTYIKQIELDTEGKVTKLKKDIYHLLQYAIKQGKKVVLVSDMYLSSNQIMELLGSCGIHEKPCVLVSCEHRTTKSDNLFMILKQTIDGKSYLHIGDNEIADGIGAVMHGVDSVLIRSPKQRLKGSEFDSLTRYLTSVNERNMMGLITNRVMSKTFEKKVYISSMYVFTYTFVAPIVTAYILWLIDVQVKECYDAILFPARDGFLLRKLYEHGLKAMRIHPNVESIYFYSSRKACVRACCTNEESIKEILKGFNFTIKDLYHNIFGMQYTDDDGMNTVIQAAKDERKGYVEYIKELGLNPNGRYGFVELSSSGTCQVLLENIFFKNLNGLYFCQRSSIFNRIPNVRSLYKEHYLDWTNYLTEIDQIVLLETLITSYEPSVEGFNGDGSIKFSKESRSALSIEALKEAHEGICDYFEEYIDKLYICGERIDPSIPKRIMASQDFDDYVISDKVHSFFTLDDSVVDQVFIRRNNK